MKKRTRLIKDIFKTIIEFADKKNNPNNMSLLDIEDYESITISYKDLDELRKKFQKNTK